MSLRLITRHVRPGWILAVLLSCWQATLVAEETDNASARAYNAAAALQNAGLYTRASVKWSEFISQYPGDERLGQAHYYFGACRLREKKFKEAAETFQTVLSRWPELKQADKAQYNLAMAQYEIATEAGNAEGFREAANNFALVVTKYAQSDFVDEALKYQGDCLVNAGDLAGASKLYQQLISQHSDSPQAARAFYDLGVSQQELDQLPAAAQTFAAFLDKPHYASHDLAPEIRLRWAICLHELNQLDAAAEQFDKVSQIANFELAAYAAYRLGLTKHEQRQYEPAAKLLSDFPKRFAKSEYRAEALKTAGQCYFLAGKGKDAIRVLAPIANSNDPPAAEAAYWLGRSQLLMQQPDQALRTIEKAIGRFGDSPFATHLRFTRIDALYAIERRRAETPTLYESFLKENPSHALAPQAAYMAALSSFGQHQYRKARELAEVYLAKAENDSAQVVPDLKFIAAESYLLESPENPDARDKAEAFFRDLVNKHADHDRVARSHLRIGWCLLSAGKHQEAINYLRGVMNEFDKERQLPEAHLLIGRCHAKLDQYRDAIQAFNAAITANGNWEQLDEVLLAAAESHRSLGEQDPAIEKLSRLLKIQPKSQWRSQSLYWLGEITQQTGQGDQAINWFTQVALEYPDSEFGGPAMHALAAVHLAQEKSPEARDWASRLVASNASDELKRRGRYLRGLAYYRENDFKNTIEDLNAYRQNPVDQAEATNACYLLALCQIHEKQFDSAQKVLGELLKAKPDFPHADKVYYELGHALRGQKNGAAAAAAFQWIADNRPSSRLAAESLFRVAQHQADLAGNADQPQKNAAYQAAESSLKEGLANVKDAALRENMSYLMGDLQFQQQKFAEAVETLTKQIGEFKNGKYIGPANFLAAQSRYQLQQFEQALELFAKVGDTPFPEATKQQGDLYRSQALYRAGDCAAMLDRWQESQTYFQQLIDQHPGFAQRAEAMYGVAYALQQQNELDRAIEVYDQVTKVSETETAAKARFMVGEIEFGRKKYEDAIEQFLIVTVGYPYESWQAVARFETARCFMELGHKDRAAETLRDMIEKHSDHTRIDDAQKMLDDLSK